jgi:hypothetical protein
MPAPFSVKKFPLRRFCDSAVDRSRLMALRVGRAFCVLPALEIGGDPPALRMP